MYFKRVFMESIAHYSYVIGDGDELIIVDPQPDIDIYLDISIEKGMKITTILETHRNEDFLVGSRALSNKTGAKVYISGHENLDYEYGEKIYEGDELKFRDITIRTLHTPGHTLGHLSYILYFKDNPYMAFVGDTCFYGDIGRVDFCGEDRIEEMAGKIYDSIFNKLMPLGDHVLMYPAHGAGSACGENTEERPSTTLGYEREYNKKLQYSTKEEFIKANSKMMYKPSYFSYMEKMNLKGIDSVDCNPYIDIKYLNDLDLESEIILDIRSQNAFNKAHIPNSIYIKKEELLSFINWVIDRQSDICIVKEDSSDLIKIYKDLRRIGYNGNISFLSGGFLSWVKSKKDIQRIETVMPKDFRRLKDEYFILDVRKKSEIKGADYKNRINIPIEEITERYNELKDKNNILIICPSGIRSNIVASFLKSKGIDSKTLIGGLGTLE